MRYNDDKKDPIANSLGITPMTFDDNPKLTTPVVIDQASTNDEKADADFDYARKNFYTVIERGTDALEEMLDLAKASEHPRAYEVVSTIMKTLVDANKDLVAMSEKKAGPKKADTPDNGTVNNNLFVGSTAELQAMLKDLKNE